ncbi:dTDP-4-dehydrorhamnose 3,5-epimerase family protein, partial [Vibrio parahaemolyticus]
SDEAEFVYKCTDFYNPSAEVSVKWDDPKINIDWPLVDGAAPRLSAKDEAGLTFEDAPKF